MSNSEEKIEKGRRSLEKLIGMIPGYKGYQEKELRRDADKKNREFLYEQLKASLDSLESFSLKLTNEHKLEVLSDVDRAIRKLRTVADKIRLADYGYAGFFDAFKIEQEELDRMVEFDLALAEQIQMITDKVNRLSDDDNLVSKLVELDMIIDGLDERFDQREKKIMGVE